MFASNFKAESWTLQTPIDPPTRFFIKMCLNFMGPLCVSKRAYSFITMSISNCTHLFLLTSIDNVLSEEKRLFAVQDRYGAIDTVARENANYFKLASKAVFSMLPYLAHRDCYIEQPSKYDDPLNSQAAVSAIARDVWLLRFRQPPPQLRSNFSMDSKPYCPMSIQGSDTSTPRSICI